MFWSCEELFEGISCGDKRNTIQVMDPWDLNDDDDEEEAEGGVERENMDVTDIGKD